MPANKFPEIPGLIQIVPVAEKYADIDVQGIYLDALNIRKISFCVVRPDSGQARYRREVGRNLLLSYMLVHYIDGSSEEYAMTQTDFISFAKALAQAKLALISSSGATPGSWVQNLFMRVLEAKRAKETDESASIASAARKEEERKAEEERQKAQQAAINAALGY